MVLFIAVAVWLLCKTVVIVFFLLKQVLTIYEIGNFKMPSHLEHCAMCKPNSVQEQIQINLPHLRKNQHEVAYEQKISQDDGQLQPENKKISNIHHRINKNFYFLSSKALIH